MGRSDKLIHAIQMIRATSFLYYSVGYACSKGMFRWIDDEKYLCLLYRLFYHRKLRLDSPELFSEKIQWIKLNKRDSLYTDMVDKYKVKSYVANAIGGEHVIPSLGIWDTPEEIDFDILPDSFVLKATHDSGGVYVVKDKKNCNIDEIKNFLNGRLKKNHYYTSREWQYKDVKPRVLAETYLNSLGNSDSEEYKLTCINGRVEFITVCTGVAHGRLDLRKNDFFDRNLNKLDMVTTYYDNSGKNIEMPSCIDDMISAAEILSKPFPTVRVDFYVHNDNFIFGEMTFSTWGGFFKFRPSDWDKKLGDKLVL